MKEMDTPAMIGTIGTNGRSRMRREQNTCM
jgi:hypothetical protein